MANRRKNVVFNHNKRAGRSYHESDGPSSQVPPSRATESTKAFAAAPMPSTQAQPAASPVGVPIPKLLLAGSPAPTAPIPIKPTPSQAPAIPVRLPNPATTTRVSQSWDGASLPNTAQAYESTPALALALTSAAPRPRPFSSSTLPPPRPTTRRIYPPTTASPPSHRFPLIQNQPPDPEEHGTIIQRGFSLSGDSHREREKLRVEEDPVKKWRAYKAVLAEMREYYAGREDEKKKEEKDDGEGGGNGTAA